jgi:hypothetical protein
VLAHTFESRSAGRVIRAEALAFARLPVGAEATIAYDEADPSRAVVVEDVDRGGPSADQARDADHRNVPSGSSLTSLSRTPHGGAMRVARRIITIVLLIQVAWMAVAAVGLGLFVDPGFVLAFGSGALVVLVVWLCFVLAWQRTDARREALLATGVRVPAQLVSSRATNTRINNRTVMAHTFESRQAGRLIRAEARAFTHFPPGVEATIAYDAADPARAVVVEDLDRAGMDRRS